MSLRTGLLVLFCVLLSRAHASDAPVAGRDYQSLQIASSTSVDALKKLYARYTQLPYLRLEQRGTQYVLRAGFWTSASAAKAALTTITIRGAKLRVAVLRPEALVQYNWTAPPPSDANAIANPAPPLLDANAGKAAEPIAVAPMPPQPAVVNPTPETKAPLPPATASDMGDRLRTFNPDDFALAYDVLLSTGDLQRAYRIAQQAVAKLPQDRHWRRKLAQVAEWTQHPDVAAEQWRSLFLMGERGADVLTSVLRLSPYMNDLSVPLQVWKTRAQRAALSPAQWQEVFQLFQELSQPAEGSVYFEAQYSRFKDIALLDYAARLADNAGDETRALALYVQRTRLAPFSTQAILSAVTLLVRMDRMQEAQALMQEHTAQIPQDAAEYWRILGQIAWETESYDTAQDAYARYAKTPQATAADWSRLIFLVRSQYPLQAAELALEAWRRYGALDQLNLSLELYATAGDLLAQGRIYQSLLGDSLLRAQQDQRFLLLRAQYYQRGKQPDLAWSDLVRALQIAPRDRDVVLSSLWFLIDEGRSQALTALLKQHTAVAGKDPAYWTAFAAGHQVLGRNKEALYWYAREIRRTPKAPLLLLNYADTLEQLQQAGMAARIRRHSWLLLKQQYPTPDAVAAAPSPELLTTARLALLNRPGDAAMQQVRSMVQKIRGLPAEQSDAETSTLVLGWAIAQEQFTNARNWMWQRYARQAGQTAPLWGESQVALQLGDTATMNRLLDRNSDAMPVYNRYDTAYALGHTPQALDIAFKGMSRQDTDEPLHDRFRQHAPDNASYLQMEIRKDRLDTLDRQGLYGEARFVLQPQLHLLAGWSRMQQSSTDTNLQTLAPGSDQLERLELQWQGARDQGSLALFHRNEMQSYMGLQATQTYRWGERISLDAGLDYRADSALSLPLQVAGYEHSIHGSLGYTLGKRHYLRATPRLSQYYTQFGDYLGSGQLLDLEAGYRIRTEYPDWRLRALLTQQDFSRTGGISADSLARLPANLQTAINNGTIAPTTYFLPDNSTSWGLCFSMGENLAGQNLQTVYSRAWRPYFDMCLRDNSRTGSGYTGTVGMVGSVTGEDHVAVELQNNDGLTTVEGPTRTLTLRYRHYF